MTEQTMTKPDGLVITHPENGKITIELEWVDPTRAVQLLSTNHDGQRSMSVPVVAKYAADMGSHDWRFAGDPIRLDEDGILVDGQHRLNGIVESGVPQWMIVISGLPTEVMMAIDAGKRRSFSNQLEMLHHQQTGQRLKNPQQTSSAITKMWHWENGNYGQTRIARVANPEFLTAQPSHAQLFTLKTDIEDRYQVTFEQAAAVGLSAARLRPGVYATTYSLLWLLLTPIDRELREKFFFELTTDDTNYVVSGPMRTLQNRMMRRAKNEEWPAWLQLHWLIQVATAMACGREIHTLRSPVNARWDLLANLDDIEANKTEAA